MTRAYVPDAVGRRPAEILSPKVYNERAELAVACPITSKVKGRMFEVPVASGKSACMRRRAKISVTP